jgi:hypothetical protein
MSQPELPDLIMSLGALPLEEQISSLQEWLESNPDHVYRKLAESTFEDKENLRQLRQRSLRVILNGNYPNLIDRTISGFYFPMNHGKAEVENINIASEVFSQVKDLCMTEEFWSAPYTLPSTMNCDSETAALFPVQLLLDAILKGLKLDKVVDVVFNRTLAGAECDILLVYTPHRLPFAVLEIKKPPFAAESRKHLFHGDPDKGGNRVAGEILAEMMGVRLFGFHKVFGMISTSNQWRLVCTHDIDAKDGSDDIDAMKKALNELQERAKQLSRLPSTDETEDEASNNAVFHDPESPNQRSVRYHDGINTRTDPKVHASQIVPNLDGNGGPKVEDAGQDIIQVATLFILKACTTLTQLLQMNPKGLETIDIYSKMPCRILTSKEEQFAFGTVSLKSLNLDGFKAMKTIHVIHHLGMGAYGNCCLGVSSTGLTSCVVKFYHTMAQPLAIEKMARQEAENWTLVYGKQKVLPMSYQLKVAGGYCLVMPYLRPIPRGERHAELKQTEIEGALRDFSKSGYKHDDIKWRHFGRWQKKLFLLDLGSISLIKNEAAKSDWVTKSMEKLRNTAGKPLIAQTTPSARSKGGKRTAQPTPSTRSSDRKRTAQPTPGTRSSDRKRKAQPTPSTRSSDRKKGNST